MSKNKGQADEATEIEVTPAMIDAGFGEFCGFNADFDDEREFVTRIWEAMERARLSASKS